MDRPSAGKGSILIVDDDEDDFFITSEYVRNIPGMNYETEWAGTYKAGLESIVAQRHDLYFVDYRLGARSGVDLLKEAKAAGSDAPIVLLTGQGNYSVDIEAMKLAAIAGRGRKRDFTNLYFLLKHFTLADIISFYNQKYNDGSEMMIVRSLSYFDDADTDENLKLLKKVDWNEIKTLILRKIKTHYH